MHQRYKNPLKNIPFYPSQKKVTKYNKKGTAPSESFDPNGAVKRRNTVFY